MVSLVKVGLAVIIVAVSVKFAEAVKETSLTTIFEHRAKFHDAKVIVHGTASNVERKISRNGRPYTRFFLTEPMSGASIVIYSRAHQAVADGASVMVEGVYHANARREGLTCSDQIEAYSIRDRRDVRRQLLACRGSQQDQHAPTRWLVSNFSQCVRGLLVARNNSDM
ncbi:MAG: hypothetical protein C4293_00430 [Nitrospiraceae bacterium]